MLAIELKGVSYTYSRKTPYEKRALDGVNLAVEKGEFVGLIGATGSGKSTLIQHLNGLIRPQEGEVLVLGMNASDKKTLKKLRFAVGMVFQYPEYQLFEDTVAKDVSFGPRNMKLDKAEIDRRVRRALDVVGLPYDEFAGRSPFELSGGEKRRAAIAGVIAMEPEILVLDEPVAGLDPAGREEILSLVTRLRAEVSPTVIMVSHYMDDIARMADRIVALKDGRIVADGNPHEVFGAREELAAAGLSLPTAARVVDKLAARGIALSRNIVTGAELVDALAEYRQKVASAQNAEDGTAGETADDDAGTAGEKNGESVTAPAAHTADGAGETADDDAGTAGEKNEESVTAPAAHTADGAGETADDDAGTAGEKNEESVTAPAAHTADGAGETADDDAGTAGEKNEESVTAPAGGKDV